MKGRPVFDGINPCSIWPLDVFEHGDILNLLQGSLFWTIRLIYGGECIGERLWSFGFIMERSFQ